MRRATTLLTFTLALALAAGAAWLGYPAIRAARAEAMPCSATLQFQAPGTWLSLSGCHTNQFQQAQVVDPSGRRTHLVMPLRGAGEPGDEPSMIALAVSPALMEDPDGFRYADPTTAASPREHPIRPMLVRVLGNTGQFPGTIEPVKRVESGLDDNPNVFELLAPPAAQPATSMAWIALVLLSAAIALAIGGRAVDAVREARPTSVGEPRPGVRWGLVAVLVLIGVVGMARAWQWYFDPAREPFPGSTDTRSPTRQARAARTSPATAASLTTPSADELVALDAADESLRLEAARRLAQRTITPEAVEAVDRALTRATDNPKLAEALVCARARYDGDGSLDFLIQRVPTQATYIREAKAAGIHCVLEALAARAREDQNRTLPVLLRVVESDDHGAFRAALRGMRTLDVSALPTRLVEMARHDTWHRRAAVRAVVALGGIRLDPLLVYEQAFVGDWSRASPIAEDLVSDPDANAARIVARIWIGPGVQARELALKREHLHHDVSAALVEVMLDPRRDRGVRGLCLARLRSLQEPGALPSLRELLAQESPGPFATELEAAIAELDALVQRNRRPLMRQLPAPDPAWVGR